MTHGQWLLAISLLTTLISQLLFPAQAAPICQFSKVPCDPAISVYVTQRGLWFDHGTLRERWGKGECLVAAFAAEEYVKADPESWSQRQLNAPVPPFGWAPLEPVTGRQMALEFTICDQQRRLGRVVVNDYASGADLHTAWADGNGARITGSCAVAAESKFFELVIYARCSETILLRLGVLTPSVDGALVSLVYTWDVNRGDSHDDCPVADLSLPGGDPAVTEGKTALGPPRWVTGCAGGADIVNEFANGYTAAPSYHLRNSRVLHLELATSKLPDTERATAYSMWPTWEAEEKAIWADPGQTDFPLKGAEVLPFSRGIIHVPVRLRPEVTAMIVFPYQGHPCYAEFGAKRLLQRALEQFAAAYGSQAPCRAATRAIADSWTASDVQRFQAGPPAPLGDVWKLKAEEAGEPCYTPIAGTLGTVPLELHQLNIGPYGLTDSEQLAGGTAIAVLDESWLNPPPPQPTQTEYMLTFPDDGPEKGKCLAQLPAGWYWLITARPTDTNWAMPIPYKVGSPSDQQLGGVLNCFRKRSEPLEVQCNSTGESRPSLVELEARGIGPRWWPVANGSTTLEADGRHVWRCEGLVEAMAYRVRAKSAADPGGLWCDWIEFYSSESSGGYVRIIVRTP